jgi:hypothetical protein
MNRAASRRPLTSEVRVCARAVFVVEKVALGHVFLRLQFSPVSIIPPWLSVLIYHLGDEQ